MKGANSSGVIVIATAPCFAHASRTSGRLVIVEISAFRRLTISRGVFRGATRPNQITAS